MIRQELLLQNDLLTPLGRLRLAGYIYGGRGVVPALPLRVYGSYALMCVLRGNGGYRDANGVSCSLGAGEAVLVFPELAHWYGTFGRHTWDELYVTFDGPAFDFWRTNGILSATRPVLPYTPDMPDRIRTLVGELARPGTAARRLRHLSSFLDLLTELITDSTTDTAKSVRRPGLTLAAQAQEILDGDLGLDLDMTDVAADLGVSYETFRKRFLREVGISPTRYRTQRRIDAAKALLRYSPQMTNRQVAETLGFADECHFSRRFTQITGTTPRTFRTMRTTEENKTHDA